MIASRKIKKMELNRREKEPYHTDAAVAMTRPMERRREICTSPKMKRPMPVVKIFLIWPVTLVVSGELMMEHRKMK